MTRYLDAVFEKWAVRTMRWLIVSIIAAVAILAVLIIYTVAVNTNQGDIEYTEAGYLIKKTTDNIFHYEFEGDVATPQFNDEYYFTVFVDDNYVRFEVPYQVFNEFKLGDHITVCRKHESLFNTHSDYFGVIYNIKVPAEVMEE